MSSHIQSPEWKKRYSALLSLGAITEGPDKAKYMDVIVPGLPNLVNMFEDANAKVREAIAWVMSRICEHHADVISNPQVITGILPVFIKALKDRPRISNQICCAIDNLAKSLAPDHGQDNN